MEKTTIKENKQLFDWCLEQAHARYTGQLTQDQLNKLNGIDFPWAYYENELDKLGYSWKKNNPDGKRWGTPCKSWCEDSHNSNEPCRGFKDNHA